MSAHIRHGHRKNSLRQSGMGEEILGFSTQKDTQVAGIQPGSLPQFPLCPQVPHNTKKPKEWGTHLEKELACCKALYPQTFAQVEAVLCNPELLEAVRIEAISEFCIPGREKSIATIPDFPFSVAALWGNSRNLQRRVSPICIGWIERCVKPFSWDDLLAVVDRVVSRT